MQIWASVPHASATTTYLGHSNTINALSWSPDNRLIASGSSDRTVQVWNPTTGSTTTLYTGHISNGTPITNVDLNQSYPSEVYALAWQPSGNFIASAGGNGILHIWDPTNGNPKLIRFNAPSQSTRALAWSPDSTMITCAGDSQTATVQSFINSPSTN